MMRETTFKDALEAMTAHNVEFVVCGGVACVLHGISRVTNDIDICARLSDENLKRVVAAARELNLQPRNPEPLESLLDARRREVWVHEKGAKVYTLVSSENPLQIDLFLEYPISFDDLYRRANIMSSGELTFRVSSKQDLIEAKRHIQPARRIDQRDIEDLEELINRERQADT